VESIDYKGWKAQQVSNRWGLNSPLSRRTADA
jgi:hypothetical protein